MGVKYVKDFSFPTVGGFHGDVQRYAKGGHVTKMPAKAKASAKDMPARAKPNAPAKGAPKMASKPAVGKRQGYDKGGRVPGREMDRLPTKRPPGRMKDLAPARRFKGDYQGYAEGGPVDEILPGDGRGGLEAVPMPEAMPRSPGIDRTYVKPIYEKLGMTREDYLNQAGRPAGMDSTEPKGYGLLEAAPPVQLGGDQYPIGTPVPVRATTPLPEEPVYGNLITPRQPEIVDFDPGLKQTKLMRAQRDALEARRAAVQGRAGMREDMGRRPAAAPAPKASRNALLRALASRMKAPTPVRGMPQPTLGIGSMPKMPAGTKSRPQLSTGDIRFDPRTGTYGPSNVVDLIDDTPPPGFIASPGARFAKGGEVKGKKIAKVMGEYKAGKLHSGSKKGPKVTSEKQAMAIALSEAGAKKKAMGGIFNDEDMAYESKGPKTRYSAAKGRRMSKERAMERRALDKARHAEKYAPGMSLDMADKKSKGGMPVHRRKPMYGGGKC
jgi:hypothetical protein